MEDEYKFWFRLWSLVAAFFITLVICITVACIHNTNRISDAIHSGVDPIAAKCALDRPEGSALLMCADRGE